MNLTERLTVTGEESEEQLLAMKRLLFQEAKAQGVISGLATIARQFGEELNANYGPKYRWAGDGPVIYVDDYGRHLSVTVGRKYLVSADLSSQAEVSGLFVPGPWLTPLLLLMEQAKQAAEAKAEQRKRDAAQALRNALSF